MHLNVKVVEILKLSGIEEHTFGPINLREHFPEEELALNQACTTYGPRELSCRKCCKSPTSDNYLSFQNLFHTTTK